MYNPRLLTLLRLLLLPRTQLLAEILLLRRQLALYREREAKPSLPGAMTKLIMVCSPACSTGAMRS